MSNEPERFTIELRVVHGWSTPGIVRLKRALKMLLRGFGLRCESIVESPSEPATPEAGSNSPDFKPETEAHVC